MLPGMISFKDNEMPYVWISIDWRSLINADSSKK